ncbi:MAG: hypothetical protein ACPG4K_14345 [Haloferula sp.]
MDVEDDQSPAEELESREPTPADLVALCRELNQRDARYVIDLMQSASGIDYQEASKEIVIRRIEGVPIPFASDELLWKMKRTTHREKDQADLLFLRQRFEARGETPPE